MRVSLLGMTIPSVLFFMDIISDPLGAVETLIRIPVNALMNSLPGSGFFKDMAAALPDKWIDGFAEWLKGNTATMSASDIVNAA